MLVAERVGVPVERITAVLKGSVAGHESPGREPLATFPLGDPNATLPARAF